MFVHLFLYLYILYLFDITIIIQSLGSVIGGQVWGRKLSLGRAGGIFISHILTRWNPYTDVKETMSMSFKNYTF